MHLIQHMARGYLLRGCILELRDKCRSLFSPPSSMAHHRGWPSARRAFLVPSRRPALVSQSPFVRPQLPRASYLPQQVVISQSHRPRFSCQSRVVNKAFYSTTARHTPPGVAAMLASHLWGPGGPYCCRPSGLQAPPLTLLPALCPPHLNLLL